MVSGEQFSNEYTFIAFTISIGFPFSFITFVFIWFYTIPASRITCRGIIAMNVGRSLNALLSSCHCGRLYPNPTAHLTVGASCLLA
jgi:hypothetical protein